MPRNSSLSEGQLTDSEYYILLTLLRPMHGYGIMQYIEKLTICNRPCNFVYSLKKNAEC